ncbi:hypothetical protein SKC37_00870 [Aquirufa sp. HETE-83D]|uniref:Uncharacterized protein n=1 Tax=Aquirufa esocilacus TaxID=3096513 RepID=A0ABW6DI53_9BACT
MKNLFTIISALCLLAISSLDAKAQTSDFLNSYFENQTPINNNTFSFSLSKVVLGQKVFSKESSPVSRGEVLNLTEFLDVSSLSYYGISPNIKFNSSIKFEQILKKKNFDWFIAKMPKLEILKNKLVTLTYSDGESESFLYNVTKLGSSEAKSNFRSALQIELATEDINNNRENTKKGDIIWRVVVLENEAYLALSGIQLNRLHLDLFDAGGIPENSYYTPGSMKGIQAEQIYEKKISTISLNDMKYATNYISTGVGTYLARNQDKFMDGNYFLNPSEMVFLFKLNQ